MTLPFLHRNRGASPTESAVDPRAHAVTSDYCAGICRFTLSCSCGVTYDTPYIDEALEWRELHESLAPLADQLATRA
jgi:hypothetical protein